MGDGRGGCNSEIRANLVNLHDLLVHPVLKTHGLNRALRPTKAFGYSPRIAVLRKRDCSLRGNAPWAARSASLPSSGRPEPFHSMHCRPGFRRSAGYYADYAGLLQKNLGDRITTWVLQHAVSLYFYGRASVFFLRRKADFDLFLKANTL